MSLLALQQCARGRLQLSKTVGTYSEGNLFVVYEIKRHVLFVNIGPVFTAWKLVVTHFPTAPSPTTTHLIVCMVVQTGISIPAKCLGNCGGSEGSGMRFVLQERKADFARQTNQRGSRRA